MILLAEFTNPTGDPMFDSALEQALTVQLQQSPFLSIFPGVRVRETLKYMGRSSSEVESPCEDSRESAPMIFCRDLATVVASKLRHGLAAGRPLRVGSNDFG